MVGAGFAGSVIARQLSEAIGARVHVIDARDHIAGNAHDPVHPETGARFHQYGPHIFHTNDKGVVKYLSRFTEWLPYQHCVRALLPSGVTAPMPINRDTLNQYYNIKLESEADMRDLLAGVCKPVEQPQNAQEYLRSIYGSELTELFFERYTNKMWDMSLQDMPISVVARLPIRYDDTPHYFNDAFQMMPKGGYTALVGRMLDHSNIKVELSTTFSKDMEAGYDYVFNCMPIDEYFGNQFGPLPYRSIKFEHRLGEEFNENVPTVNFTDTGTYTRKTSWALYPGCGGQPGGHVTYEIPCSYEDNNLERYYPIKTIDG